MQVESIGSASDAGIKSANEDRSLCDTDCGVFALADGSGGPGVGDQAAYRAIDTLAARASELRVRAEELGSANAAGEAMVLELERTIGAINDSMAADLHERRGGCSLAMAFIVGARAWIAHVGGVRVWLLRDGDLSALTTDHSAAALRLAHGRMSSEAHDASPLRHTLYQALGAHVIDPDVAELRLLDGDTLVFTSSGLHVELGEPSMCEALLAAHTAQDAAQALIRRARETGSKRNATALVLRLAATHCDESLNRTATVLREVFLTQHLPEADRVALAPYLELQQLEADSDLCTEGDPGDDFWIVIDGRARVSAGDALLTHIEAGGTFGELCLIRRTQRSATVTCATSNVAYRLTRTRFHELIRRRPHLGVRLTLRLLDHLGDRLRDLTDRISEASALASGARPADNPLEAIGWTLKGIYG